MLDDDNDDTPETSMTDTSIETTIAALEDERYDAMLHKRLDVLERLYHDKLIYMHSSGVADTKQSYLEGLGGGKWDYLMIRRAEQRITCTDNLAMVFHQFFLDVKVSGVLKQMSNRALAVWTLEDGRWQLIAVQSGMMPQG
jgi:hypothetical protein